MFLKKIDGLRAVTMADGSTMTRADLPPSETSRWVVSRKAAVVRGIAAGLISQEEAIETWSLSQEELCEWRSAVGAFEGCGSSGE